MKNSSYEIQRSVESPFSVHVLPECLAFHLERLRSLLSSRLSLYLGGEREVDLRRRLDGETEEDLCRRLGGEIEEDLCRRLEGDTEEDLYRRLEGETEEDLDL